MNLAGEQLKDTYGNLLTTGTTAGSPTTGTLQNGDGQDITALDVGGTITSDGLTVDGDATIALDLNVGGAVKGNAGTRAVSIGTAGSVIGGLQLWSTTSGTSYFQFGDESGTPSNHYRGYMSYNHANDSMALGTASATKVTLDSSGNVGIGTTLPSAKLHVNDTTYPTLRLSTATSNSNIYHDGTTGSIAYSADDGNAIAGSNHQFYVDGASAMNLDGTGLGIGTTSPNRLLHLYGGADTTWLLMNNDATGSASTDGFSIAQVGADVTFINRETGYISFQTSDVPRMTIDSSGQVGIGTDSPSSTAHLRNTGASSLFLDTSATSDTDNRIASLRSSGGAYSSLLYDANTHKFRIGTSEKMRIDSSGNVGMNAVPENSAGTWRNYQLGSLSMAGRANDVNPDAMFGTNFKFTTANAEQRISADATSRIFFNDDVITFQNAGSDTAGSTISWNERMRIDSNGDTTHIASYGGGTFPFRVGFGTYASFTPTFLIDDTGAVGIGTTSPSDRLEVKGATAEGALVLSSGDTTIIGNDVIGQINFKDYDADAHAGGDQNDLVNIKAIALHESGGATALDGSTGEGYALSFSTSKRPSPNALFTVSEAMRIDSSGNVGIGQTNPSVFAYSSRELHVKGGTGTNESASFIAESAQSASGFLGGYYWVNGSATDEFQKRVGQITLTAGSNADRSNMDFLVKQGVGNYSTAMTIDSSGNVGINCTPVKKLQVTNAVSGDAGNLLLVNTNDTNGDTASLQFSMTDSDSFNKAGIFFERTTTQGRGSLHFANNIENNSNNVTKSDARLTIDSSGNVGIGGTSIGAKLDIQGTDTEPLIELNGTTYIFSANIATTQSNTHTVTIPFTSQTSQYSNFLVEIYASLNWTSNSQLYAGKALYTLTNLNSIGTIVELEDNGQNLSFSASSSGMNFIVTITTTGVSGQEPNRIGVMAKIIRANGNVSNEPTSMTIA